MKVKNEKQLAPKKSQPKKRPAQKVAHAQPSAAAAEQRYKELFRSIPKHGEKCVRHGNALMADLWAMAEEVHELKAVCHTLKKPYEADAINLCGGETAFHYLRDLYTAFGGKKQKALECGKATALEERALMRSRNSDTRSSPICFLKSSANCSPKTFGF